MNYDVATNAVNIANTNLAFTYYPLPPSDLVVLVNPAAEAFYMNGMKKAVEKSLEDAGWSPEIPWMVSISSDSDWATRSVFPPAMMMTELATSIRGAGFRPGVGERLRTAPHQSGIIITNITFNGSDHMEVISDAVKVGHEDGTNRILAKLIETGSPVWMLTNSPVWMLKVEKNVIDGHNDFFNKNLLGLIMYINEYGSARTPIEAKVAATEAQAAATNNAAKATGN
jgi:hypothetical protein